LNSRLNFRLFIIFLQFLGHDLIFVSTKPAAAQPAKRIEETKHAGALSYRFFVDSNNARAFLERGLLRVRSDPGNAMWPIRS